MTTTTGPLAAPTAALTYQEAADLAGCSPDTIKRDREQGKYPDAFQDSSPRRTWRVPVANLVTAGRLHPSQVEQAEQELAAHREGRELRALREENIRLSEQLAGARELAGERQNTVTLLQQLLLNGAQR
jgi:hypothetical protein